jgi:hypothetical protein
LYDGSDINAARPVLASKIIVHSRF